MAESENKRTRRTPQERAAEMDEKIAKIDQSIKELELKKESVVAEYDAKITAADVYKRQISMPCTPGGSIWISALSGAINSPSSLMQCGMGRSIFWIW